MSIRASACIALAVFAMFTVPARAQSTEPPASRAARTVIHHPRDLVALRTKLHYTTLVVLPDGEDVVEATCGDKEFWMVNVRGPLMSVKPVRPGTETNLNVVTAGGHLYAFVLTEISNVKGEEPDLTVYVESDELTAGPTARVRTQYVPAEQLEDFKAQAALARDEARRATDEARASIDRAITEFRGAYPLRLAFPYRFKADKAPFFIRAMFHDDHRTFIQARAPELPSLYELKDGRPSLVNFDVRDGTFIVPKILDSGYLTIGRERVVFERVKSR